VGLPLLTTVVPRSHPLENPFRIGDFSVTPLCPCSLTPKKLSQKPQRFFFFGHSLWFLLGFYVVGHGVVIVYRPQGVLL